MKSGRASRTTVPYTSEDAPDFRGQRAFTAWIAAIYTFMVLLLGSVFLCSMIFAPVSGIQALAVTGIVLAMLIPNTYLTSLVWDKVYNGHQV